MPESQPALSEDLRGLAAFLSSEIGPRCAHEAVREAPSIAPLGPMGVGRSAIMPLQLVELQQPPESNTGWVEGETAMAEFDDREDRREEAQGRRATDSLAKQADDVITRGWRWAQILATIIGFAFMAGVVYIQSVAEQAATAEMRKQLTSIEANFNAMSRENVGRDKDIGYLKDQQAKDRAELLGMLGMIEARTIVNEKDIATIKAR